ncbi:MAG: hypothetical protein Pg6C_11680 [Treponemataceae bacterium]|nr:MAG: hypothetical protein Pg6C_11680 [Treponemataceae bacterium]
MNGNTKGSSARGGAKAAALGLCVLALVFGFALAGCDNPAGGGGDDDPPKTVAAEYRFTVTGTEWIFPGTYDFTFTLGETSAVKIGVNAFSLTGVYTEGGGTFSYYMGGGGKWAYLYDNTGKIGVVLKYTSGSDNGLIVVGLGAATVEDLDSLPYFNFTPAPSEVGMSVSLNWWNRPWG